MKKIVSLTLCIAMLFVMSSCAFLSLGDGTTSKNTEDGSSGVASDVSIAEPSSEPEPQSQTPSHTAPEVDLTEQSMYAFSDQLIRSWDNYQNAGMACSWENSGGYDDLLSLVDPEVAGSAGSVVKCSCCNSIAEAQEHLDSTIDPSLATLDTSRLIEKDGSLYCVLGAKGHIFHALDEIKPIKATNDTFVVEAPLYGSGGDYECNDSFTISWNGSNFVITAFNSGVRIDPKLENTNYNDPVEASSSKPEKTSSKPASSKSSSSKAQSSKSSSDKLVKPDEIFDPGYHCTVNADGGLNMRYGPGKKYGKIALIPNGTPLVEEGYKDGWIYVKYKGKYGWVSTEFVQYEGGMAKPVIYLYPTKKTDVKVSLDISGGKLSCTYPQYNNGWNVTAYPGGRIVNKADGLEYSYLYWEGESNTEYDMSQGYVVRGSDTAKFLQSTLSKMGLTPKEYNEFIVYWLPLMQNNKYNLITFQQKAYTDAARLSISPKPDSMLRIFMAYQALDKPVSVKQPEIKPFERNGFTVVEWGGTEVK
ncbi:MAG: SH3 domain-containing protein [Clostridia bacterium]|nr:SH3 domain-containing protein [Clostridia bacterium]